MHAAVSALRWASEFLLGSAILLALPFSKTQLGPALLLSSASLP